MAAGRSKEEKVYVKGYKPKIPILRIKRLIQADEDVGKVAHATPVIVERALGLFLADLVQAAAKEAGSHGTKRITAQHLKRIIHEQETFDFLKDKVEHVKETVQKEKKEKATRRPKRKKVETSDEDE